MLRKCSTGHSASGYLDAFHCHGSRLLDDLTLDPPLLGFKYLLPFYLIFKRFPISHDLEPRLNTPCDMTRREQTTLYFKAFLESTATHQYLFQPGICKSSLDFVKTVITSIRTHLQ